MSPVLTGSITNLDLRMPATNDQYHLLFNELEYIISTKQILPCTVVC